MAGLRALAHYGVLYLDEITDFGLFFQHRTGAQARVGANFGAARQCRAFDVAEGADPHAVGHGNPRAEHHIGLYRDIAAQLGVPGKPHGFGRDQAGAIGHRLLAAARLPAGFRFGKLGATVDPGDFIRVRRHHHRAAAAIGQRDVDHIGEVIFALRIGIADPGEQREQICRARSHQA